MNLITKGAVTALVIISGILSSVSAQSNFNFDCPKQTLENRVKELVAVSKKNITFDSEEIGKTVLPALKLANSTVEQALEKSLSGSNLTYKKVLEASYVIIRKNKAVPAASTKDIGSLSGTVLDEGGQPVGGASVTIPGTTLGAMTDMDGHYSIKNIPVGTHILQFSFISYETQLIDNVKINSGRNINLDVVMKEASNQLSEVVVSAKQNRRSTTGALQIQKMASQVSTVLSSEQISRTPDKNVQEALKRVSGVSLVNDKQISVRGMSERWNAASLDGVTLPSTDVASKSFSFDLIPASLIDNITVSKSITPDMNITFAGGYVQVSTRDIPEEDFFTLTIGGGMNDQSTFKNMWMPKRGKWDYLGFDDGRRDFPNKNDFNYYRYSALFTQDDPEVFEQSKQFKYDLVTPYKYTTLPQFNAQMTWGKVFRTDDSGKFGLVTALSYRNTQSISKLLHTERGNWNSGGFSDMDSLINSPESARNHGNIFKFSTILSGIVNAGWEKGKHRLSTRNTYTRKFDNDYSAIMGYNEELGSGGGSGNTYINYASPVFMDLLQNKLEGDHELGIATVDWSLSHTFVNRRFAGAGRTEWTNFGGNSFGVDYTNWSFGEGGPGMTRPQLGNYIGDYRNQERMLQGEASVSLPFNLGALKNTLKTGGMMNRKNAQFSFREVSLGVPEAADRNNNLEPEYRYLSFQEAINAENVKPGGYAFYATLPGSEGTIPQFDGVTYENAFFGMFDHKWKFLRLVWGARMVNYKYIKYANERIGATPGVGVKQDSIPDKEWELMPSANLTFSPWDWMNLRFSYSKTVLRPELQERSEFHFYDPVIGAYRAGLDRLYPTHITAWDGRLEFYPETGEIISAGVFYRFLDKPIELVERSYAGHSGYTLENSNWAKNWGLEFELRKNFAFISSSLKDLWISGNATFIKSEIDNLYPAYTDLQGEVHYESRVINRPLYGQTPYIYNIGLSYDGERFGANIVYNGSGRKVLYYSYESIEFIEYQDKEGKLDAQISYHFKKPDIHIKVNVSNLLNPYTIYYYNVNDYEIKEIQTTTPKGYPYLKKDIVPLREDADSRDKDDIITYITRPGRTFSFSLSWNF